jgi:DNA-binding response OmpR family regulator
MAQGKPRILVVDDESEVLLYLFDLLSEEGYRVDGFSSAIDALRTIARRTPDLVLADLGMPEMDGLELLERIKRLAPRTRVILLGAAPEETMRREALARGGEEVLEKALEGEALLRVVRRLLEGVNPQDREPGAPSLILPE